MTDDSTPALQIPSATALVALASFIPALSAPDVSGGEWKGGDMQPNGAKTFPWFDESKLAMRLRDVLDGNGFVQPFDWGEWSDTERGKLLLFGAPLASAGIATASAMELVQTITALIRADRTCEGVYSGAITDGRMLALARRAAALGGSV